jgi:pyrrolysyl-tRNA synthetase-like protein
VGAVKGGRAVGAQDKADGDEAGKLPAWVFAPIAKSKKRTVRRHADPYSVIEKVKLWPSKTGLLHGVRSVKLRGGFVELQTHCGQAVKIRNSRNSRVARHLRNKIYEKPCPRCRIPAWKLEKFGETSFI